MKKIHFKILTILFAISVVLSGCKKDFELSKATFWPDIKINGDVFKIIYINDTYTDENATVTVNGSPIDFTTDNTVDPTVPGYYTVTYTASNEDGISASQSREVLVVDTVGGLREANLSGSFTRNGVAGTVINWEKDENKPFTYIANNIGGVSPTNRDYTKFNVDFVVYNVAPGIVVVPEQNLGAIGVCSALESLGGSKQIPFNTTASSGDVVYAWVAIGPNFGTGLRTFIKL
jgi:hypothetical protein